MSCKLLRHGACGRIAGLASNRPRTAKSAFACIRMSAEEEQALHLQGNAGEC